MLDIVCLFFSGELDILDYLMLHWKSLHSAFHCDANYGTMYFKFQILLKLSRLLFKRHLESFSLVSIAGFTRVTTILYSAALLIAQSGMNRARHQDENGCGDNVGNQYGNGNVVIAPAEGNGNGINGNPIRCYNCRGEGHYASNCTVKPRKRDAVAEIK
ncbi:zf-CCHC domain-containing protein [Tanacetum coccineum]